MGGHLPLHTPAITFPSTGSTTCCTILYNIVQYYIASIVRYRTILYNIFVLLETGARKRAAVGKDNWTPYRAYLRSDLRTSPPLKRRKPPQFGLRRC
ncbi:hypothetical protein AVEN_206922-1 [Araneus ventricosus]|uniref:Uncharacterized protein n=1 Tax=Araneus ventricosus TaxID=182803 RepID=A0A4Y2BP37_ARAVE|nr:hypothetical protein AVEN_206922-1 [Araneus ventricosus]